MRRINKCIFILFLLAPAAAFSSSDQNLLIGPKDPAFTARPSQALNVSVWNTYKGGSSSYEGEFERLAERSDLMLLQEILLHDRQQMLFTHKPLSGWIMAEAWMSGQWPTGTALLSAFKYLFPQALLSPDKEPFTETAKSSVAFRLPIEGHDIKILVINSHLINFTGNKAFKRQLKEVAKEIQQHNGPVLWAGDFNTWRSSRWRILYNITEDLGLSPVIFNDEPRLWILDHVFVRGLTVSEAEVLIDFNSSDHWPLFLKAQLSSL